MAEKKIRLISLKDAEKLISPHYKRSTLYKKIHFKVLKRYGPRNDTHLDMDELITKLHLRGIVDAER